MFLELDDDGATPGSLAVLGRAREVFGRAAAVIAGRETEMIGAGFGRFGAEHVYALDSRKPVNDGAVHADVIWGLVQHHGFGTILFEASGLASDVAGALSARLSAGGELVAHGRLLEPGPPDRVVRVVQRRGMGCADRNAGPVGERAPPRSLRDGCPHRAGLPQIGA